MAHTLSRLPAAHYRGHPHKPSFPLWPGILAAVALAILAVLYVRPAIWPSSKPVAEETPLILQPAVPQIFATPEISIAPAVPEAAPSVVETMPQAATQDGAANADLGAPAATVVTPERDAPDASAVLSPSLGGHTRVEDIDLSKVPVIADFAERSGGLIELREVRYADLTGDGSDEGVVAITSQGTYGNLGYFVVGLIGGWPATLFETHPAGRNGIRLDVVEDHIVVTEGIYGPEDPACCPSTLRKTSYSWDGATFQPGSVETVNRGQKLESK